MNQQLAILVYVVISLGAVVTLIVLLVRKKKSKEGFRKCICSQEEGGRERECQDTVDVNNLYVTNKLTEFSKFPSKGWGKVSPGDIEFPESKGCNWPDCSTPGKGWVKWDFTDFGS